MGTRTRKENKDSESREKRIPIITGMEKEYMGKQGRVFMVLGVLCLLLAAGCWWWGHQRPRAALSPQPAGNVLSDNQSGKPLTDKSMYFIKEFKGDLYGNRQPKNIALYLKLDRNDSPVALQVFIDGQNKITEPLKDGYTMADCKVENLDGRGGGELLVYQCCTGSSGAMLLDVYQASGEAFRLICAVPELTWDQGSSNARFETKYLGNYQVGFREKTSGLYVEIPLDKASYAGREDQLKQLTTWVDPYNNYLFKDIDGDGVKEITAQSCIIGLSHPDLVAQWNTTFKMKNGMYHPVKESVTTPPDAQGNSKVLAEVQR